MEYGFFGLIILVADIFAIYAVLSSNTATLNKIIWTVAILALPVLGFIAWALFGPRSATAHI